MSKKRKKLGEILVDRGLLTPNQLADALQHAQASGKRTGEALVELELCSEEDVASALASQFGLEFIDLGHTHIDQESLSLISNNLIVKHQVIPMGMDGNRMKVIITDPLDLETLDLLRFRLNCDLIPALGAPSRVKQFIDKFVDTGGDELSKTMASIDQDAPEEISEDGFRGLSADESDSPIIKLINQIISEAVHNRASDIHIEPMGNRVRVRYRIDGVCIVRDDIPLNLKSSVTTRLKIMAGMDIAEKRVPQDGRIKMKFGNSIVDFRVSACPAYHGESVVLRILRPESAQIGLAALGFEADDNAIFQKIIRRPNGIFLVTGPTGSGKTTTLYAALQELNRPDKKIITAEDPVEYNFTGMNQCQVRDDIGLTFSRILRSMLRQAPNIILIGEIRDREVGEIAIQAALTGHLVFSTLHTNDAPSSITRLIDMGIKPFLVASSIQAIMAQRLIRIICSECKAPDPNPDPHHLALLGFKPEDLIGKTIYKGTGCKRCSGTGYRGRRGIFEIMVMSSQLRELAFNRAPANQLRAAAKALGMRTLLDDGKRKILAGMTTPEELLRTTQVEGVVEAA
ncbi:MAG: Flp pilus assembly complex ATPase component TadA [Phycisphaerae bacterium]|nr:MAG: type II/IV secretion system protein [Phycisphaerae bacterium]MBE7458257.1 Flp pilus assembly complex ATPase component TadA [Planctomycetia bacterium]MCQ3922086.1 type II/IV secretion system protein [Planctomycetota bacterium]MCK6466106.1 Flp pilus assembly complex ATPase component TadA [Phycisphaerae bacterium]MCL4718707.1 Flp pilus assembly complex ATPase component TadA [Phycisphaerae bacterium]